jgi:hypothetical protein
MNKHDNKDTIDYNDHELVNQLIHEEEALNEEQIDDLYEPYAGYGEEYEDEPLFEKTNRQKGVRKVRD